MIRPEHLPDNVHGWLFIPEFRDHGGPLESRPFELIRDAYFYTRIAHRWILIPGRQIIGGVEVEGYRSDWLSIPRPWRWLLDRAGPGRQSAWLHDWLCDARPQWCSGKKAHLIFEEALRMEPGVRKWRRVALAQGTLRFGPQWERGE